MLLFLLSVFPLSLITYWFYKKDPKIFIPMALGFLASAVVCAINFFFQFSHRVVPYSFGQNLFYFVVKLGLVPLAVVFLVFCLVSKDTLESKIDFFIPLMASYYAVLIPYYVITSIDSYSYSSFDLFLRPLIYDAMVFTVGNFLRKLYFSIKVDKKGAAVHCSFMVFLFAFCPSLLEAFFATAYPMWLVVVLTIAYMCFPVISVIYNLLVKVGARKLEDVEL